jgi:hypothetical protein
MSLLMLAAHDHQVEMDMVEYKEECFVGGHMDNFDHCSVATPDDSYAWLALAMMVMKVTLDWNLVLDRVSADHLLVDPHDSFPVVLDIHLVVDMDCSEIHHLVTFLVTYLVTCLVTY